MVSNSYLPCPPQGEECIDPRVMQSGRRQPARGGDLYVGLGGEYWQRDVPRSTPPRRVEPGVFTVGATGYQTNTISGFSSRGPVLIDG